MPVALSANLPISSGVTQNVGVSAAEFKVTSIALKVLLDLGTAFAINCVVLSVIGPSISLLLCSGLILISVAHLVYVGVRAHFFEKKYQENPLAGDEGVAKFSLTNTLMLSAPGAAIHESFHYLTAWSVMQGSLPKMKIYPFAGGATQYFKTNKLTAFGKILGQHLSERAIKVAGIAGITLTATIALVFSDRLQGSHANASRLLEFGAISIVMAEVMSGLQTFVIKKNPLYYTALVVTAVSGLIFSKYIEKSHPRIGQGIETAAKVLILNEGIHQLFPAQFGVSKLRMSNDFINIWVVDGIHPIIPVSLIAGIPLSVKAYLGRKKE